MCLNLYDDDVEIQKSSKDLRYKKKCSYDSRFIKDL